MVLSDRNEVTYSNDLMKIARCSRGSFGVLTDVIFELTPSVMLRRSEIKLNINAQDVSQTMQQVALDNEHCWIQWVIGKHEDSDDAAVIALSKVANCEYDECSDLYDGRCWYPYGETMRCMMRNERKRHSGEKKHTMQWSFPSASFGCVVDILKSTRVDLSTRVVEFKFLSASTQTYLAPNSVREGLSEGTPVVALNVWWELSDLRLFEMLEARLCLVSGAKPHYGKWVSSSDASIIPSLSFTKSKQTENIPRPMLSIILPVYNAMPWLTIALRDILKQEVEDEHIEILAGDDASSDGSLQYLVRVALLLGERGSIEVVGNDGIVTRCLSTADAETLMVERIQNGVARSVNPALLVPSRAADSIPSDHHDAIGLSCDEVTVATGARNRLRVLFPEEYVNCGQGVVMTRCLKNAHGAFVGHMESDDARPHGAFQEMMDALRMHPDWDGVASNTECIGCDAPGMERYIEWQNQQDTPEKMRLSRFIEIPALHQAGIFRAAAVFMSTENCCYRDNKKWPADMHFWLSFFHAGLKVGKVSSVLFYWRQHHGQQTRNHGRLSISSMRKCKCEFLCDDGGPIWTESASKDIVIEIWSTGQTLEGWVHDISSELERRGKKAQIVPVDWKPGLARHADTSDVGRQHLVRLFAFGTDRIRRQVLAIFAMEWDDDNHIFVA